jgi:hypothetical protein
MRYYRKRGITLSQDQIATDKYLDGCRGSVPEHERVDRSDDSHLLLNHIIERAIKMKAVTDLELACKLFLMPREQLNEWVGNNMELFIAKLHQYEVDFSTTLVQAYTAPNVKSKKEKPDMYRIIALSLMSKLVEDINLNIDCHFGS